jgi:hypothetical protein
MTQYRRPLWISRVSHELQVQLRRKSGCPEELASPVAQLLQVSAGKVHDGMK